MDHTILISIPLQCPLTGPELLQLKKGISETLCDIEQNINISDIKCFERR